jgi:hypothetical protein
MSCGCYAILVDHSLIVHVSDGCLNRKWWRLEWPKIGHFLLMRQQFAADQGKKMSCLIQQ